MSGSDTPEIPKDIFDVSGIEHRRITRFKPEYIGNGAENIVYSLPDYPDYVAKVFVAPLIVFAEANARDGRNINQPPKGPNAQQYLDEVIEEEKERIEQLRQYFGSEHVLEQDRHKLKVPVSMEILENVYKLVGEQMPKAVRQHFANEAWAVVTIQQKVPEAQDENRFLSGSSGYAEIRNFEDGIEKAYYLDSYNLVTSELITHTEQSEKAKHLRFSDFQEAFLDVYRDLQILVIASHYAYPEAQPAIREFLERCIKYTQETGEILDLGGKDNVIFPEGQSKEWSYKLIDPLYPPPSPKIDEIKTVISKVARGEQVSQHEEIVLFNGINYVRVVNGLARIVGVEGQIDVVPEGVTITPEQIWETLYMKFP